MKKTLIAASIVALTLGGGLAQAATITQTFTQALSTTDWTKNFNIAQFDASLGTLNSVTIDYSGNSEISASLKNNGTATAMNVKFTGNSDLYLDIASGMYSNYLDAGLYAASVPNIAAGATQSTGLQATTATPVFDVLNTGLSAWIGAGSLAGIIQTATGFGISGLNTANVVATVTNQSAATLNVIYDYTAITPPDPPGAVPVPAAVWLFGSGIVGLVGASKRRKAAALSA